MSQLSRSLVLAAVSPLALLAACGGGSTADAQVASLPGTDAAEAVATEDPATDPEDTQEALLAFAECLREQGLDVGDPTFDADGNPTGGLFGPDSGIDPRSEEFQAAQEACGSLMEGVTLGGLRGGPGGPGGAVDQEAIEEALLEFSECLRDEGLDVGDITLPEPGQGGPGGGGFAASGAEGADSADGGPVVVPGDDGPPGGLGDPTARLIESLGLDPQDATVAAAMEACQPILEAGFGGDQGTVTSSEDSEQ